MTNNVSVLGIGMLMVGALFFLPIPYFSMASLWFYLIIFIPYLLFTIYLDITGKVKNKRLKGYAGYFGLLLFAISFGVPAIKQFYNQFFLIIIFIVVFIVINIIVFKNSRFFYKVVLPDVNKFNKFTMLYWGLFIGVIVVGGGHFTAPRFFAIAYGQESADTFYSILFLIISYFFTIFATSSTYKLKK